MADFRIHLVIVNYVCNSERFIKIEQYLTKLCSNEKGSSFLTHIVKKLDPFHLSITFANNVLF